MFCNNESDLSEEEYIRLRLAQIGIPAEEIDRIMDTIFKKCSLDNKD